MNRAVGACKQFVGRIPGAMPQAGIKQAFGPKTIAMPQSLSLVIVHVIFSRKERRPLFLKKYGVEYDEAYVWD
jgi:hypothetical protein